jgi:glycosyltransferase involved in cell wall biosynthesis
MPVRFSLVIPAYDEEHYLPRLLDSVQIARARCPGGPEAVEVIVADNGSRDGTARVAQARGCLVVPVEKRVIAAVRNGGAKAVRGDILCFVDADSALHPDTFAAIAEAVDRQNCGGGATGVRMERWSTGIALAYAMMMPLVWLFGIDTGVVFCRRRDFEALGGYDEGRKFAEDVHFYVRNKAQVRRRGERYLRLRHVKALGSTRKFDVHGDWHYVRLILAAPFLLLWKRWGDAFAKRYWYVDGRSDRPLVPPHK